MYIQIGLPWEPEHAYNGIGWVRAIIALLTGLI
jgi:hypothetical protein